MPSSRWETDVGYVIAGKENIPAWKGRQVEFERPPPETIGEAIKWVCVLICKHLGNGCLGWHRYGVQIILLELLDCKKRTTEALG